MNWYYQTDGKEVGPITQSTLRELRSCGTIGDETMVRSEVSDAWQPYSQAFVEATESIPGGEENHSFGHRMKEGAKEGWGGIKRHSKQVALKAQIEKLRNVDLRKAYHELGKKCFESGIFEDVLLEEFQAIRDLDASIAEKRVKAGVEAEETKMATLKRKGMDAAHASHAQALTVKREHLITELGRQADATKTKPIPDDLKDDFTAIADIEERIHQKEAEMRKLGDGGKSWAPTLAVAAVLALLVVAGAFIGVQLLGGGEEKEQLVRTGEHEPLGDVSEDAEKNSEQLKNTEMPWTKPSYSVPEKRSELSTAQKWLRKDCSGPSFEFKGFAFGMSRKELETHFKKVTGSSLSYEGEKDGVVRLSSDEKTFTLIDDRVIHYSLHWGWNGLSRRHAVERTAEKMREILTLLEPVTTGPVIVGTEGGASDRENQYSEIGAANFRGRVMTTIGINSRDAYYASAAAHFFCRNYLERDFVPRLDCYLDSISQSLKENKITPALSGSVDGNSIQMSPPFGFDHFPGDLSGDVGMEATSVLVRGLILCLAQRFPAKDGTSVIKPSESLTWQLQARWESVDGLKVKISVLDVTIEKPLSF